MKSSATTLMRACRTRPSTSTSQTSVCLPGRTKATVATKLVSNQRDGLIPYGRRTSYEQRAHFSTSLQNNAQPINDIPAASSSGLDATLLGNSSNESSSLPETILSRAATDPPPPSPKSTPPTSSSSLDPPLLPAHLTPADLEYLTTTASHVATVTRVGTMNHTVRCTTRILVRHRKFQKDYTRPTHVFVHDPHNLLLEGDVIRYGEFPPSLREKRDKQGKVVVRRGRKRDRNGVVREGGVRWMVREIVSPFGLTLEERRARSVGGVMGRWKGTDGEVRKVSMRQRGRKSGTGKGAGRSSMGKGPGPDGKGKGQGKKKEELVGALT